MSIFKLAIPGKDVSDAGVKDTIIDSHYPTPKIDTKARPPHAGIININYVSTTGFLNPEVHTLYSFPHGYGYIPMALGVYHYPVTGQDSQQGILPYQPVDNGPYVLVLDTDITNVNIKLVAVQVAGPAPAIVPFYVTIRYYVFAERGYTTST